MCLEGAMIENWTSSRLYRYFLGKMQDINIEINYQKKSIKKGITFVKFKWFLFNSIDFIDIFETLFKMF